MHNVRLSFHENKIKRCNFTISQPEMSRYLLESLSPRCKLKYRREDMIPEHGQLCRRK